MSSLDVAAPAATMDPITFEVVRHKLTAIAEEQAITLKSVSGSPVVTDATDFNTGLYLADGSIVVMGPQVLFHSGTMSTVIRSIIDHYGESPGIRDGDMWILNDSYRGAVHQPDVSIVAPIFHEGELIAWTGACAHQLDVGGMSFGGWAVQATEVQQESMILPGVRFVEDGEVRADLWQMIMRQSRLPHLLGLDLKAMIAANNVAIKRLREVMDRYGTELVRHVMLAEIDASEQQLRARLRELPDGVFRAADFLEHDGHADRLYDIRVTLTKRGDALEFDFAGSSPQAPGFINCTRAGLVGAVLSAVLPILAPDIRWNHGILRAVTVAAPEGSVVNATFPAPVSMATTASVWVVMNVSVTAVSRLVACSPATAGTATAVTKGSMVVLTLAGVDRDGGPFGTFLLDSTAGGGGAYADHDGLDASGDFCVPRPGISNVESNEANGPFVYLYRRLLTDTGGAGRMRGGATVGLALTPHDAHELSAMVVGHGSRVPNSTGLFGGLEGSCNTVWHVPAADDAASPVGRVVSPETLSAVGEPRDLGPKPGFFTLKAGEVFAYSFQGGGGFGDPLERDPERVLADVGAGRVSAEQAERLHGVVLSADGIDAAATARRRGERRAQRLGGQAPSRPVAGAAGEDADLLRVGPALRLAADRRWSCRCGEALADAGGDWKDGARMRTVSGAEHGAHVRVREELELREHACPGCATLLESEVVRRDAPSLRTIELTGGGRS
jgi:N-methylhydantoinase B